MMWWIENVVRPCIFFMDDWFWLLTALTLVVSSVVIGKIFHPKSFDSWHDYFWPVLFITMATFILPLAATLIFFILPFILGVLLIASVGGGIFWAVQNNFWIKRNKRCP